MKLEINGKDHVIDAPEDMPLLWALRDILGMTGTKFGCGMAVCGACTVHLDGVATRSCTLPLSAAVGKKVTTIEGIAQGETLTVVQQAWLDLDVVQCGYCQSGQIMSGSLMGLSAALGEAITFKDGRMVQSNFHDYPVMRLPQAPAVDVHIIESGAAMGGVGEPGTPPAAPALANAIAKASGKRLRVLPLDLASLVS